MAITNFIPELWSANILLELQKNLVYGSAVNRDYEGDIANYGDTVHITGIAHISIGDYTAHTDITIEPATDKDAGELVINQSKYFAFEIDDVEKRQAMNNLTAAYSRDAAYKLRDLTDQYLAGLMAAGAKSKLDPISGATATKAYDTIVDLGHRIGQAERARRGPLGHRHPGLLRSAAQGQPFRRWRRVRSFHAAQRRGR